MFALAVSLVVGYFVIQTTGYLVHKALHHPLLGKIHETHDIHHKRMYPPEDYLAPGKYREVPNEAQPFKYYAAAAIPLVTAVFLLAPLTMALALTAELLVVAWANDWLHQKFHIEGFWMERYSWFHELRALHWHHHVDDSKNLGIFSWFADSIFRTYEEVQTTPTYLLPKVPNLTLVPFEVSVEEEAEVAPVLTTEVPEEELAVT